MKECKNCKKIKKDIQKKLKEITDPIISESSDRTYQNLCTVITNVVLLEIGIQNKELNKISQVTIKDFFRSAFDRNFTNVIFSLEGMQYDLEKEIHGLKNNELSYKYRTDMKIGWLKKGLKDIKKCRELLISITHREKTRENPSFTNLLT